MSSSQDSDGSSAGEAAAGGRLPSTASLPPRPPPRDHPKVQVRSSADGAASASTMTPFQTPRPRSPNKGPRGSTDTPPRSPRGGSKAENKIARRKGSEWEILGSLEKGVPYSITPKRHEGFLSKRRKFPLKGWHKRYFVLDRGALAYGKSPAEMSRGRTHGRIEVGAAVVSAKTEVLRIDIDDEQTYIHHLRARDTEDFAMWLEQLKQHRLYQQHLANSAAGGELSPEGVAPGDMARYVH